ncbi:UDP-xylose transporter 2 [Bienertia sinuspersici]
MGENQRFQLGTIGALSLSVVSSVSIVICNKALISTLGFSFATTLTSWHLLVTFCSLHVALWLKMFEHKPFDPTTVMAFGILNGISIGLLNLSLGFNSVGFYQMTKLAIIPCTVSAGDTLLFEEIQVSRSIQFSLGILLLGVGIATITDLQLNLLGSVLSLLAILTTCVAQIMTNSIQKKFKVSSTQLLYQSCPYQAITLFIFGPFLDGLLTNKNVFAFSYTPKVLHISCDCWRNILGILVAVVGMALYSYYCTVESPNKASETSSQLSQSNENDSDPLIVVENGSSILPDNSVAKGPVWNSKKDVDA